MGQAAHGSLEQSLIYDSRYHDTLRESEYPISRVLSPRTCSKLPQAPSKLPGSLRESILGSLLGSLPWSLSNGSQNFFKAREVPALVVYLLCSSYLFSFSG